MKRFFLLLWVLFFTITPSVLYGQKAGYGLKTYDTIGGVAVVIAYTVPASEQRNLFVFFSKTPVANNLQAIPSAAQGFNRIEPLGKIADAIVNQGYAEKTVTLPDAEAGWYYLTLAALDQNGSYEVLVPGNQTSAPVRFGNDTTIYADALTTNSDGNYMRFDGHIDTQKHPDADKFSVTLEISTDPRTIKAEDVPSALAAGQHYSPKDTFYGPHSTSSISGPPGVSTDPTSAGRYYIFVPTDPGVSAYYYREVIVAPNGKTKVETGKFTGDKGIVIEGSTQQANDFEKRSYRLLAPWPGLAVLLDPSLCQEMLKEGKPVPSTCTADDPSGFGNFLNYIFRLLIGLSAVFLVFRLIFEGYRYITTDVPFLKTNAKSGIGQAAFGLLTALSAWLILNTINPKLVANTISIQTVNLILTPGEDGLGVQIPADKKLMLQTTSGQMIPVTACGEADMVMVTAFGTTFKIQKNLVPSIQRIDTKWRQLNPAYKIPMTVEDGKAMGGYVCRAIAGKSVVSYHAFGLAVDINPLENPQGKTLKTDMPTAFIKLWKDEGWGWGGDWQSSKDPMHFSKGKNEGGNMAAN